MRWGALISMGALLGCGTPQPASDAIKVSLPNKHYFLANGLEVVLEPDHHSPYVAIRMRYHVGSKDDPPNRSGFAHLVEHMTFAVGTHVGTDQMLSSYGRLGSLNQNGGTWLDWTDYYALLPSSQLEGGLWLEAERMTFVSPALDKDVLEREINVVGSELSQHYGNAPYGWMRPMLQRALFPAGHPYQRSVIGNAAELHASTTDEIAVFLKRYYVPDDATLLIVGDFNTERTAALVEKHFGSIPPGSDHTPPRTIATPQAPARTKLHAEANVPYPLLAVAWLGPPPSAPTFADTQVALSYITGNFSYRTTHLSKMVASADWEAWGGKLAGIFALVIKGERGATFDGLSGEAKRALWAVATYSPAWWDISSPRARMIGKVVLDLEDLVERSEATADGLDYYGTADYAQPRIDNLRTLTPVSVQGAAESLLTADRATYVWIEPNSGAPPAGREIP